MLSEGMSKLAVSRRLLANCFINILRKVDNLMKNKINNKINIIPIGLYFTMDCFLFYIFSFEMSIFSNETPCELDI
jgi:hypothetical protein